VKQRVWPATWAPLDEKLADFFTGDYDIMPAFVVLAHLSEQKSIIRKLREEAEKRFPCAAVISQPRDGGGAVRIFAAHSAVIYLT